MSPRDRGPDMIPTCAEELEANAGHNWTKFYSVHENKFFKNRNWLFTDFPELSGSTGEVTLPRLLRRWYCLLSYA